MEKRRRNKNRNTLKLIPLGGLGEIGRNMTVVEYMREMLIIDCGIMFPDNEMLGIDLILPDYSYVRANARKLKGILITHGHEDHIGAIPYLYKELGPDVPIYAPQLAMELIKGKLNEHRVRFLPENLHVIQSRSMIKVGNHFRAEFISVNHSISDSFAIALHTRLGTIFHTGDFRIDYDPVDQNVFDFYKFSEIGEKGVLMLLSDSTNVEKKTTTVTERDVATSLDRIIQGAKGRVITATFASHISRVSQIAQIGIKYGRKVGVFGRNMESNFEVARKLGYINIADSQMMNPKELKGLPEDKQLIIMTGSQGEPMSALSLMSRGMHKIMKIRPGDTVILSASAIPGNEKSISKNINALFMMGANVVYGKEENVHVSGHASNEQLQMLMRMLKPKYFVPIHGEMRHLVKHAQLVRKLGWSSEQILLATNGDVIEIDSNHAEITDRIALDTVFVDGSMVGDVKKLIKERKTMSEDGIMVVMVGLRTLGEAIECMPDIISRGFFFGEELKDIIENLKELITAAVMDQVNKSGMDYNAINSRIKKTAEKYVERNFRKNPMIITRVIEIEG